MIYSNYLIYGGHKSDFYGHNKRSFSNIMIYPYVYGTYCLAISTMPEATPVMIAMM